MELLTLFTTLYVLMLTPSLVNASHPPQKQPLHHERRLSMQIQVSHDSMKEFIDKLTPHENKEKHPQVIIDIPTESQEASPPIHVTLKLPPNIAQRITGAGIFLIATHSCLQDNITPENTIRCITGCANMAPETTSSLFKWLLAKCCGYGKNKEQ